MEIKRLEDRIIAFDSDVKAGELTFVKQGDTLIANHTYVEPSYRGMGVASELFKDFVDYVREKNYKVKPVCSYIVKKFETGKYDDIIKK